MKYFFSLIILICTSINLNAQVSNTSIQPKSIQYSESISSNIPVFNFEIDPNDIQNIIDKKQEAYPISLFKQTNISPTTHGIWTELQNGSRIWRLKIQSANAKGLNLYFKDFELPLGSTLHIYSKNYEQILGAYTMQNNDDSKLFATEITQGDACTIEYYEPNTIHHSDPFKINEIAYYFRGLKSSNDFNDAEPCLVNAACSEGDSFKNEQKAIVRILAKNNTGTVWCTGTLINNILQDCKPYLLTAAHCAIGSTTADFNQWIFYFNFESPTCINPLQAPIPKSIAGSAIRAQSIDGGDSSSDFTFLELKQKIPTNYQVNFAGWSNLNLATIKNVSIHQPVGDVKKIASSLIPTNSVSFGGVVQNTHWKVTWANTVNGKSFTMGGSSGSALLNMDGLIIGTLTGGPDADCQTNIAIFDYYGKMSMHWNPVGSTNSSQRLKEWLDPNNTAATSVGLKKGIDCAFVSDIHAIKENEEIKMSIDGQLLQISNLQNSENIESIKIIDAIGRLVYTAEIHTNQVQLLLNFLHPGVYILSVRNRDGQRNIKFKLD